MIDMTSVQQNWEETFDSQHNEEFHLHGQAATNDILEIVCKLTFSSNDVYRVQVFTGVFRLNPKNRFET